MGKRRHKDPKSLTLPSSPAHSFSSSSSSDFEFTISLSPRMASSNLCPADELFYKGQLLPLHLSPRLSMVRTLLLASSSSSSCSDSTTTASRDSTGSSNDSSSSFSGDLVLFTECDSSRPSSVTEEDEFKRLNHNYHHQSPQIKKSKYFSLARFSSVFRKDNNKHRDQENASAPSSVKRMSASAKDVIRKYLKKVKPLYEKLSQKQQQQKTAAMVAVASLATRTEKSGKNREISASSTRKENNSVFSHSFSGNLKYPRRKKCVSSCPSSTRSSPSHSGVLCRSGVFGGNIVGSMQYADSSSMEELQSAIQGAITHCKNSLLQKSEQNAGE
ncbi:PREDICTED: probable membrane-associated kinase regulator 1 [Nelumbo nucifera]|uniref:Probable membrane-associated kinase regulator 1 n=1 Tax=Nelumbo nucifera TaxID=4432 RepID=A0A1U8B961_NELNU|nr:PREDICTED: probable membrane-associated kinase regulator 1 [Nelumbo nucifera]